VWTCAARPLRALAHVRAGEFPSLASAVVDAGSMTDGQRLMLGILVSVGFLFVCRSEKRSALGWALLLLLQTAALILNFKRGSWLCAAALVAVFMASETKWRYLLVLAAVAVAALAVPPVRARLVSLREEVDRPGGRVTMWTKIAPALIRQHPWGIGWRSLTNERMRSIAPEVEADRNHLHSNPVQVLVETGWLGLAVYVLWMASAVADAAACVRRGRGRPRAEAVLGRVLLLMLAGLLLNGLVEYNLADGEIVLLYSLVMGAAAAGDARNESRPIGLFWPRKRRSN
jgi:O-antigen ligase